MKWIGRIALAIGGIVLLGLAIVAVSVLLSLDWDRTHREATARLPQLAEVAGTSEAALVQIDANGMTFRARVAGLANDGPGLLLLHGFPETSAMWSPLIPAAAEAGYRVIAFDQRGYSPGARPDGVEAYVVSELVADVIAVADAAGFERFHLVGHDWGCVVGWGVAIRHPARLLSWTGLSIPHPGALAEELRKARPAYIRIFTAPLVPEAMLAWNDFAGLREGSYAHAAPAQREEYLAVFSEPGALTAALDWYRAITTSLAGPGADVGPVQGVPTLFLWGTREGWVSDRRLALQRELVNAPYDERELEAGHFLMQDRPAEVVAAVLAQLEASGRRD
jgi:pimeloyl-ACP methyl ester carboxylesterase